MNKNSTREIGAPKLFRTSIVGIGPFCVEFSDGEIVTTTVLDPASLAQAQALLAGA